MDRDNPDWKRFMSKELKDIFGSEIHVGDRLLKPTTAGRSAILESCKVTCIKEGKMYLDNSKVPVNFPGRCVNISKIRVME